MTDEPNTRKSIAEILGLMKEGRDWVNIIPFLEGLKQSGRKVKAWQMEKIVRRMGKQGRQGVVLEMLRRVEGTGVRLGELGVAREAMWGGVLKCVQSAWSEEGVRSAERFVEAVWEMLSEERHVSKEDRRRDGDPKTRPEIVGVVLWVRSLWSVLFGQGKDEEGKVRRAAEMVMAVWGNKEVAVKEEDWYDANRKLMMWVPVWHGMKMARKVVGDNTPLGRSLKNAITLDLEPTLEKASRIVGEHVKGEADRRGRIMYNELSKVGM